MRKIPIIMLLTILFLALITCQDLEAGASEQAQPDESISRNDSTEDATMVKRMELHLTIDGNPIAAEWEDNESVDALMALVKDTGLSVSMSMYGGFEQVGYLGANLPQDDVQTKTEAGDIVLYSGDQIVVFYGSNSWAYTRLGRITDKTAEELTDLLGKGDIALSLSVSAK